MSDDLRMQWINRVEEALAKAQILPMMEASFPFPWDEAAAQIGKALSLKELAINARPSEWKMEEGILAGMGNEPVTVSFEVAPIDGLLQWIMSSEDVAALSAACLSSHQKIEGFSDRRIQEGFYQFLLLEVLHALDEIKAFPGVSLRMLPQGAIPKEGAVCVDVAITLPHKTVYGRLACPQSFMNAFKSFQPLHKKIELAPEKLQGIEVSLRVEIGSTTLSPEEWRSLMVGDFISLDHASYDPSEGKGSVTLLLESTPLLLGRLKPEGIKIADYAFYYAAAPEPVEADEISAEAEEEHLWESEEVPSKQETAHEGQISLTIELDPIRMPAEHLLGLKIDQILDASLLPSQNVHVVIQGRKAASGDILKLGESIGIRILSIYG